MNKYPLSAVVVMLFLGAVLVCSSINAWGPKILINGLEAIR